jgi:hypothetical protein
MQVAKEWGRFETGGAVGDMRGARPVVAGDSK